MSKIKIKKSYVSVHLKNLDILTHSIRCDKRSEIVPWTILTTSEALETDEIIIIAHYTLLILYTKGGSNVYWINHTSLVAVVTQTDPRKSARDRYVIKVFDGILCCEPM